MKETDDNFIGVQFNSSFGNGCLMDVYENELQKYHIILKTRDLNGSIMNAALDFVDYDFLVLGYDLLQNIIFSGCYDIIKNILVNIWSSIRVHNSNIPFTIKINGIPTDKGSENISCKVEGSLTRKQKGEVIAKTFDLANSISNNHFILKERGKFYDAFGAHVLRINPDDFSFSEIDIEEEIRKESSK